MERKLPNRSEVLIIGGGICGLMAAENLMFRGIDTIILEKSHGVGGRMATRRIENGVFDHGAQFITVRHSPFDEKIKELHKTGDVGLWCHGFHHQDGHPRYYGTRGMTTILKNFAQNNEIRLQERVIRFAPQNDLWQVWTQAGKEYVSR